jgi:hypothetical protein
MKTKKPNAEQVWKQLEDLLVPRLRLGPIDRAAYCYLLRHSRMEGKLLLRFSMPWLARGICLGPDAASRAVRRLVDHEALRLLERSNAGPGLCPRHPAKRHERVVPSAGKENDKGSLAKARSRRLDRIPGIDRSG